MRADTWGIIYHIILGRGGSIILKRMQGGGAYDNVMRSTKYRFRIGLYITKLPYQIVSGARSLAWNQSITKEDDNEQFLKNHTCSFYRLKVLRIDKRFNYDC